MRLDLKTGRVQLEMEAGEGLYLKSLRIGDSGFSWLDEANPSGGFSIQYDGSLYSGNDKRFLYRGKDDQLHEDGSCVCRLTFEDIVRQLRIDLYFKTFRDFSILDQWVTITNQGLDPIRVERVDTCSFNLNPELRQLSYFIGNWGHEFTPVEEVLDGRSLLLQSLMGRSAGNGTPLFHLEDGKGRHMTGTLAWSGNWTFRFQPLNRVSYGSYVYQLTGGLHDVGFFTALEPGCSLEGIHLILSLADGGGLDHAAGQLAGWGRKYWYLKNNDLAASLPVEWNHWWPYEDNLIDQPTFLANAERAAEMGVELCTLDAGWFGPSGRDTSWPDYRGDWDRVNRERFPDGIEALSAYVHEKGMKFGLWCEIEALGAKAALNSSKPGFAARRDGQSLGYLCFGNPEVQDWACNTLDRLIREYRCDWIKIDFNVDPGYGCNEPSHGHTAGDGLLAHYTGFYDVLDRVRAMHPEVVLENCSSGGLRTDLEMMRHFHISFLSDPDLPEHNLQLIWGFTTAFAPERALHFPWSDTKIDNWEGYHPNDGKTALYQVDFYLRTAMLNGFGISHKLPELPAPVRERFSFHIRLYKEKIRELIKQARVYHLTGQPNRSGKGERWTVMQYHLPEKDEGILFIFRLNGAPKDREIVLKGLEEDRHYTFRDQDGNRAWENMTGGQLMTVGLIFTDLLEEDSRILFY